MGADGRMPGAHTCGEEDLLCVEIPMQIRGILLQKPLFVSSKRVAEGGHDNQ